MQTSLVVYKHSRVQHKIHKVSCYRLFQRSCFPAIETFPWDSIAYSGLPYYHALLSEQSVMLIHHLVCMFGLWTLLTQKSCTWTCQCLVRTLVFTSQMVFAAPVFLQDHNFVVEPAELFYEFQNVSQNMEFCEYKIQLSLKVSFVFLDN